MKDILKNNSGMALLITVTIITILMAATLEMNRKVRSQVIATAATRDKVTLDNIASAGINVAMAMLVKDKKESNIDSIQEDWANPEKVAEALSELPLDKGNVTFVIKDELGKIQVNALAKFPEGREFNDPQKIMWDRFSRLLISQSDAFEELEATAIINSVKDWLDSGDDDAISGLNGAESEHYKDLDPPYSCRNGPMTHIEELLLVKMITRELFYGMETLPGISEFMTVHGMVKSGNKFSYPGKININTADLPVLIAMVPSENMDYAQNIFDYRQETEDDKFIHDLSSPTWYKNAPECADLTIEPEIITTSSDIFRIEASATLDKAKLTVEAVVVREKQKKTGKWRCRIISRKTI